MSKTYSEILDQIEGLKVEAERLRREEVAGVVARIREAIVAYGLTPADLGFGPGAAKAKRADKRGGKPGRKAAAGKPGARAKFRDSAGNVWGGRGPRPRWLREALAAGKSLQDFAV
jgi:DNA-binding protein H-NS